MRFRCLTRDLNAKLLYTQQSISALSRVRKEKEEQQERLSNGVYACRGMKQRAMRCDLTAVQRANQCDHIAITTPRVDAAFKFPIRIIDQYEDSRASEVCVKR
jgi:hypothetical protein